MFHNNAILLNLVNVPAENVPQQGYFRLYLVNVSSENVPQRCYFAKFSKCTFRKCPTMLFHYI